MQAHFTGGTASPSGTQPASLTTKDPITQFVIEHSNEFKYRKIVLTGEQEVPGTHPRVAEPKSIKEPVSDVEDTSAKAADNVADELQTVTVADKADAVEWLKEHCPDAGYTSTKLRTKEAFDAACAEAGVVFEFAGQSA